MALLNKAAYKKTFGAKMLRLGPDEGPPFDFWTYFEAIPKEDFDGYDCSAGAVEYVWRSDDGKYEHVLINTKEDKDVFMVVVLDLFGQAVFGHLLVDLKAEYGLRDQN